MHMSPSIRVGELEVWERRVAESPRRADEGVQTTSMLDLSFIAAENVLAV